MCTACRRECIYGDVKVQVPRKRIVNTQHGCPTVIRNCDVWRMEMELNWLCRRIKAVRSYNIELNKTRKRKGVKDQESEGITVLEISTGLSFCDLCIMVILYTIRQCGMDLISDTPQTTCIDGFVSVVILAALFIKAYGVWITVISYVFAYIECCDIDRQK
jgi:hypothetical protein